MHAIVDLNGKQYQVEEGRYVTVDRLALDENATFEISNVLFIADGEDSVVGAPFVEGAVVKAKLLRHARGPKILVYKMRCKKGYRRKNGHRQDFTQLQIEVVDFPGKKDQPKKAAEKPETAKKASKKSEEKPAKAESKAKAPKAAAATEPKEEAKPKAKAPKAEKPANEAAEVATPIEATETAAATEQAPAAEE